MFVNRVMECAGVMLCSNSTASDQSAHMRSQIGAFLLFTISMNYAICRMRGRGLMIPTGACVKPMWVVDLRQAAFSGTRLIMLLTVL